ncbi:DUF3592 domain-containing protein [Glaciecola siphonariae]|uniref:DUF3592 domain-containing protein n=1 Tax=Glaciecola siphonariae TaxID=521012 RepID=A0ABV9LYL9_9ALTE
MMNVQFFGGMFFIVISAYLLAVKFKHRRMIESSQSWPSVFGRILSSEAKQPVSTSPSWHFWAEYEYKINGQRYTNNLVTFYTVSQKEEALALAEEFPTGELVKIYYKPNQPGESVLKLGDGGRSRNAEVILATIGMTVGIAVCLAAYFESLHS